MSDYLEKIKKGRDGESLPPADKKLTMAWVNEEVKIREIQAAKKYGSPSAVYCYLANNLKKLFRGMK